MADFKLVTVRTGESEKESKVQLYTRMGFELVSASLYERRNDRGETIGEYYELLFKFPTNRKNSKRLWKIYKTYKKKKAELEEKEEQSTGNVTFSIKAFLILSAVLTVVLIPFMPMLFGEDFADFYTMRGFLFDLEKVFDTFMFVMSIFLALVIAVGIATVVEVLKGVLSRKKRLVNAMDKIPTLRAELQKLLAEADLLRNE